MLKQIIQKGDSILHNTVKKVAVKEIISTKIKNIIHDMSAALRNNTTGIGIAAPQIGIPLAIFLVSEEAMQNNISEEEAKNKNWSHMVFINPKLIKGSKKKVLLTEGCLSIDGVFGKVKRSRQVMVEAYDERGKKFSVGASGLFSQVLQHELDHLDGILFIDKAERLEKVNVSENKNK